LDFQSFEWLSFHHVLRELNGKEDELSKEVLLLPTWSLSEPMNILMGRNQKQWNSASKNSEALALCWKIYVFVSGREKFCLKECNLK
jgi:hypothetical protein